MYSIHLQLLNVSEERASPAAILLNRTGTGEGKKCEKTPIIQRLPLQISIVLQIILRGLPRDLPDVGPGHIHPYVFAS